jgi:hypothetical protein
VDSVSGFGGNRRGPDREVCVRRLGESMTLLGLAQAYARIATGRNVQATFLHRTSAVPATGVFAESGPLAVAAFARVVARCERFRKTVRVRARRSSARRDQGHDCRARKNRNAQRGRGGRKAEVIGDCNGARRGAGNRRRADLRSSSRSRISSLRMTTRPRRSAPRCRGSTVISPNAALPRSWRGIGSERRVARLPLPLPRSLRWREWR